MIKDHLIYIRHIHDCIQNIKEYTAGHSKEDFLKNKMIQDAVVRNIEIIGEAANQIPQDFINLHSELNWRGMIGMRNVVAHEYFRLDLDLVWDVVERDIPILEELISNLLK